MNEPENIETYCEKCGKVFTTCKENSGDLCPNCVLKQAIELIAKGFSPCCEAPIDKSRVIAEGRHKGHGARFCSKCKKVVYMV